MSIQVVRSGILDTIQDNGRVGYSKWGINPGGTMDRYAAQTANALVGSSLGNAVIEIHFPAGQFLFHQNSLISLTGADFTPLIDETPVRLWKCILVKKGSILSFRQRRKGWRCYLGVHRGLTTAPWLESRSTNLKISAGGNNGQLLKKNDIVPCDKPQYDLEGSMFEGKLFFEFPWSVNSSGVYDQSNEIDFVEGSEWNWLDKASQQTIHAAEFTIDPSSDRMGYYLIHDHIHFDKSEELLSSAVSFGTMQGLPGGRIAVLMADHQTTGGYPRIGHIATAHLPKLAQLGANDRIRFRKITPQAAEKMLFSLGQELSSLQQTCLEKLSRHYAKH